MRGSITWDCELVPSNHMPADAISRWIQDRGERSLHLGSYEQLKHWFLLPWCNPDWDMWALQTTNKEVEFVARWEHYQVARVDAFASSLQGIVTRH
mmetsp:Transcript_18993/g.31843  ORF Transcript_18993/g.31843 Transcript_18993/m.31843 type:complete len:96 (+) Transcript_18993:421-708(+)